jgi:hypothetical protein
MTLDVPLLRSDTPGVANVVHFNNAGAAFDALVRASVLPVLLSDLEMLVNVGGRERTTDEYATLLARSGLRLARTISLGRVEAAMGQHLIEAQLA